MFNQLRNNRVLSLSGSRSWWPSAPSKSCSTGKYSKSSPLSRGWPPNSLATMGSISFLGLCRVRCMCLPTHLGSSSSFKISGIYPGSGKNYITFFKVSPIQNLQFLKVVKVIKVIQSTVQYINKTSLSISRFNMKCQRISQLNTPLTIIPHGNIHLPYTE